MEFNYNKDEWDAALEAAETAEWDPIDAGEQHGPLAQWLCDQVIDHEKVARDSDRIEAAITVLADSDELEFSPERLITVLDSYRGETVDNFRTLAEEYAEENGYQLAFVGEKAPTDDDYLQWYLNHGVSDGEVFAPIAAGGTLHWFDSNKW